jgi:hypothetical protein
MDSDQVNLLTRWILGSSKNVTPVAERKRGVSTFREVKFVIAGIEMQGSRTRVEQISTIQIVPALSVLTEAMMTRIG